MELSEQQVMLLLQACANQARKQESERAFQSLYLEYHKAVRNYIWKSLSQDMGLIEEVVQDTFFEVWQHPERFRGESKFKTWLLSIARFKAIDGLRKRHVEVESIETVDETLISFEDNVLDKLHQEQIKLAITTCLEVLSSSGKLSAAHKEALHLAYIEDFDINEIAEATACPESTVKTRLFYARQQIKNCIKKRLFGDNKHEIQR
jgi:RNA polymerase sigma-70 factor, ECF subfamily